MAGECEAVADLFVEFVDGHGWLVSVDDVNLPAGCGSATRKSPPAKNNSRTGRLATPRKSVSCRSFVARLPDLVCSAHFQFARLDALSDCQGSE